MASNTTGKELTPKMLHYCRAVASGMTQAGAYREAYSVGEDTKQATVHEAASRLMRRAEIRARVERLIEERERAIAVSAVSDREKVLRKLRLAMDPATDADGNKDYASASELKAAELLGRSVGLFRDVVEDGRKRSSDEVEGELERRLAELLASDSESDSEEGVGDTSEVIDEGSAPGSDNVH